MSLSSRAGLVGLVGHLSLCFPLGGEGRRFLSGDPDFTSLDQERNTIPNESIKLEILT
jgi:hypothetical protein